MQQVKANVVVFDGGVELNRDGDQTEGEDVAGDGPSHPARVSPELDGRSTGKRISYVA